MGEKGDPCGPGGPVCRTRREKKWKCPACKTMNLDTRLTCMNCWKERSDYKKHVAETERKLKQRK